MSDVRGPVLYPEQLDEETVSNGDLPRLATALYIEQAINHIFSRPRAVPAFQFGIPKDPIDVPREELDQGGAVVIPVTVPPYARDLYVSLIVDGFPHGSAQQIRVSLDTTSTVLEFDYNATQNTGLAAPISEKDPSIDELPWIADLLIGAAGSDAGRAEVGAEALLTIENISSAVPVTTAYIYGVHLRWTHVFTLEQ